MKRKKKIEKDIFAYPHKHRFSFVIEGESYFEATTYQLSEIISKDKAFYSACTLFNEVYPKAKNVAVFYGEVGSPELEDKLYRAYSQFTVKKKKRFFRLWKRKH